ncbi:MAG: hypothetical protein WC476_01645 [Phycisphaerae bacterium]|jgi:hypothetical protein
MIDLVEHARTNLETMERAEVYASLSDLKKDVSEAMEDIKPAIIEDMVRLEVRRLGRIRMDMVRAALEESDLNSKSGLCWLEKELEKRVGKECARKIFLRMTIQVRKLRPAAVLKSERVELKSKSVCLDEIICSITGKRPKIVVEK